MPSRLAHTLFDPDSTSNPAVARHIDFVDYAAEVPVHTHRKGQLIVALYGAVICRAENDIWIVPPDCAVWIPGGIPHSAKATWNAHLNYLFIINNQLENLVKIQNIQIELLGELQEQLAATSEKE